MHRLKCHEASFWQDFGASEKFWFLIWVKPIPVTIHLRFLFFSPTQSHLNPAPIPKPMPSVFGTVSMFLRVSPRLWLNTVLGCVCVCVCVVQEPVSQSPNIPPHPFALSAGKGGAWRGRKDRAQQFHMPHVLPASSFLLTKEQLETEAPA